MASHPSVAHADVLAVFEDRERPGVPLTAPEVADSVGCARRTAHKKLTELAEEGVLETKKVGARGRVWWRPASRRTDGSDRPDGTGHPPGRDEPAALRKLHDATRRLMRAERHETVCEVAVDAAEDILGLSLCGLWLHAPERGVLEPVAWTESGVEEFGEPPSFPLDGSLVGRAFREGEDRVYDDVTTEEELYDPGTSVRSELILPLGEHGALNATSPDVGAFDAVDVSLGRLLARNVETALDRVDRLEQRRARNRELERQRDELRTLNQINALIGDTMGALVDAATRAEIERTLCRRLAASEFYVDAWIVERDSSSERIAVRAGAGGDDRAVGELTDSDGTLPGPPPILTAIEERTPQVIPRLADDERVPDRLRAAAVANGARACLVVPLSYADTVFGGLVVHAPEPDGFGDRELAAFETLGRVVGFVINATNNRQLLLGTTAVEIEAAVRDADAGFLSAAERFGGTVVVEGVVPTGDGALIEYVTVEGIDGGRDPADLVDATAIEDARVLAAGDDRWFLECTVGDADAGLRTIVEYGATVRSARAADGAGTVTARFPPNTSPRAAMAVIEDAFPDAEFAAKRVVDLSDRTVSTMRRTIADRLTDRQLTALRAAALAGYYDTPRGTTAQELAASLDIAPSTLYQHLQAAQRKLLETVFEEVAN